MSRSLFSSLSFSNKGSKVSQPQTPGWGGFGEGGRGQGRALAFSEAVS